jgi:CRP-like cAMP-binding protein
MRRAWLPHRGVISLIVNLSKSERIQVAMIGRDSIFGVFSSLGDAVALTSAVVLVPGIASTIELEHLHAAADRSATLRALMMRHGLAMYAQVQQTAGCNAAHPVEARIARCLLQIHDLSGAGKFVLTQELTAQMIGARQTATTFRINTARPINALFNGRCYLSPG